MSSPHKLSLHHNTFWLSHERCIFWEEEKALIVSDLHFGKTGHFRKSGIPVPQTVFKEDLQRLFAVVQFFKPGSVIIVGDLFHSHANKEMDLFLRWRQDVPGLQLHLVKGNHDILRKSFYTEAQITVSDKRLIIGEFCFTHDIASRCEEDSGYYTFSGHIHPGVKINGFSRQSLYFPCFYFRDDHAILPAFSRFTGIAQLERVHSDKVFAIVENNVLKV